MPYDYDYIYLLDLGKNFTKNSTAKPKQKARVRSHKCTYCPSLNYQTIAHRPDHFVYRNTHLPSQLSNFSIYKSINKYVICIYIYTIQHTIPQAFLKTRYIYPTLPWKKPWCTAVATPMSHWIPCSRRADEWSQGNVPSGFFGETLCVCAVLWF